MHETDFIFVSIIDEQAGKWLISIPWLIEFLQTSLSKNRYTPKYDS